MDFHIHTPKYGNPRIGCYTAAERTIRVRFMGITMNRTICLAPALIAALLVSRTVLAAVPAPSTPTPAIGQAGLYPVSDAPYGMTVRSVSLDDLARRDLLPLGTYKGTPQLNAKRAWYDANFYATLAARKVWPDGAQHYTHDWQGPISWTFAPIPQAAPAALRPAAADRL